MDALVKMIFLLIHEEMHRLYVEDPEEYKRLANLERRMKWNIARDFAVNPLLNARNRSMGRKEELE